MDKEIRIKASALTMTSEYLIELPCCHEHDEVFSLWEYGD